MPDKLSAQGNLKGDLNERVVSDLLWPFLWEGKRACPQLWKALGWNGVRAFNGLGCSKRNLCFHPKRCSFIPREATSIPSTTLPTPILISGHVLPPFHLPPASTQSLPCPFRGRASPPRQSYRGLSACCAGWRLASCHADRGRWQHKGTGQSERHCVETSHCTMILLCLF